MQNNNINANSELTFVEFETWQGTTEKSQIHNHFVHGQSHMHK